LASRPVFDVGAFIATIEQYGNVGGLSYKTTEVMEEIKRINRDYDISEFVSKMRDNADRLSPNATVSLSIAISKVGFLFEDPLHIEVMTTTAQRAALLVIQLVSQLQNPDMKVQTLKTIIKDGQRLDFVYLCYSFATKDELRAIPTPFTPVEKQELGKEMLGKIKMFWSWSDPFYLKLKRYSKSLFLIWAEYGTREDIRQQLVESFKQAPGNVVDFVRCIPVREGDINTKTIIDADFGENEYITLSQIIDPVIIYDTIQKNYGNNLEVLEHARDMAETDKRAVRQFVNIHRKKQT
jgi:hypothetical protein